MIVRFEQFEYLVQAFKKKCPEVMKGSKVADESCCVGRIVVIRLDATGSIKPYKSNIRLGL